MFITSNNNKNNHKNNDDSVKNSNESIEKEILVDIKNIVLSCLSLCVALGFNDLVTTLFNTFLKTETILSRIIYVIIIFAITIVVSYIFYRSKIS